MFRLAYPLIVAAALSTATPATAQISWTFVYQDGAIRAGGVGFADPTVLPGETVSLGQLRRETMSAAAAILNTHLDGRGSARIGWRSSPTTGTGHVAEITRWGYYTTDSSDVGLGPHGSFQNGQLFQRARTNQPPALRSNTPEDAYGFFNFGYNFNYVGQNNPPSSGGFDLLSVAMHEILHGAGLSGEVNPQGTTSNQFINGEGLRQFGGTQPDVYAEYDRFLQRGNTPGQGALFNTDRAGPSYGSFVGNPSTFTNGNDPATGLFFGGRYATEVFGSPVPILAPANWVIGSSGKHTNTSPAGLMNSTAISRRLLPHEIAMLIDIGWNSYDWNGSTGSWLEGATNVNESRWRTGSGIVRGAGNNQFYNHADRGPAPILPVSGQVTSNIVLRFGGTTAFTATNDIGSVRLARLELSSTAASPTTIAGGTLNFGQNADGSASVLAPKIVQNGSGAVVISSTIRMNNVPTQVVDGVTFRGSTGLTVEGPGTGRITFAGPVVGTGTLTKGGNFTLVLASGVNTYTGNTTVQGGTLAPASNGSIGSTPSIAVHGGAAFDVSSVSNGFTLGANVPQALSGAGIVVGNVTVASGASVGGGLRNGATVDALTVFGNVTVNRGSRVTLDLANLAGPSNAPENPYVRDRLVVIGAGRSLDFRTTGLDGPFAIKLLGDGLLSNGMSYTIAVATVEDGASITANGGAAVFVYGTDFTLDSESFAGFTDVSLFATTNNIYLTFTPVPEPTGLLAISVVIVVAFRRCRPSRSPGTTATVMTSVTPKGVEHPRNIQPGDVANDVFEC